MTEDEEAIWSSNFRRGFCAASEGSASVATDGYSRGYCAALGVDEFDHRDAFIDGYCAARGFTTDKNDPVPESLFMEALGACVDSWLRRPARLNLPR
jgi:hypothetical protein